MNRVLTTWLRHSLDIEHSATGVDKMHSEAMALQLFQPGASPLTPYVDRYCTHVSTRSFHFLTHATPMHTANFCWLGVVTRKSNNGEGKVGRGDNENG